MSNIDDILRDRLSVLSGERRAAAERFMELGIPDRHNEQYRHTDMQALLAGVREVGSSLACDDFAPLDITADRHIVVCNARGEAECCPARVADTGSALTAMTVALADRCTVIDLDKGQNGVVLVDLRYRAAEGEMLCPRIVVRAAEGAEGELVFVSRVHSGVVSSVREIVAGRGAHLKITDMVQNSGVFVESRYLAQSQDSVVRQLFVDCSTGVTRTDCINLLEQQGAECTSDGVFVCNNTTCDTRLDTRHDAPHCQSHSLVKGIAAGSATGVFAGRVYVAQDAQKTDAQLTNRNILVGDKARIHTNPTLEIYADDVKCGHGSTVGQLDSEAVYYMRQRGIDEVEARRIQLHGFASDVIAAHAGVAARWLSEVVDSALNDF